MDIKMLEHKACTKWTPLFDTDDTDDSLAMSFQRYARDQVFIPFPPVLWHSFSSCQDVIQEHE